MLDDGSRAFFIHFWANDDAVKPAKGLRAEPDAVFAALLLFVGTLRDHAGISLFVAFGFALLFTMGALLAFLTEMLLASSGIRDLAASASEEGDAVEPVHDEGRQGAAEPSGEASV